MEMEGGGGKWRRRRGLKKEEGRGVLDGHNTEHEGTGVSFAMNASLMTQ